MTDSARCVWCDGPFKGHDRAACTTCGQPFHLAMRIDIQVRECGQVWINDALEALEFGCNRCLGAAGVVEGVKPRRRYARIDRRRPASLRRPRPPGEQAGHPSAL